MLKILSFLCENQEKGYQVIIVRNLDCRQQLIQETKKGGSACSRNTMHSCTRDT